LEKQHAFVQGRGKSIRPGQERSSATQQKSVIYVHRHKQFVGSALAPSVYCDETQLARMVNGRYFAVTLEPGMHTFRSNDLQSGVQLDIKADQEYYIRVEIAAGLMKGHGRLILMAPERGRHELQSSKLKPLDANKVLDASPVSITEAKFDEPLPPAAATESVTATSTPKPAAARQPGTVVTGPVNEVTLSDTAPETGSQMSLGDPARAARQKKTAHDNTATSPQ